jgi:hypothetical protein
MPLMADMNVAEINHRHVLSAKTPSNSAGEQASLITFAPKRYTETHHFEIAAGDKEHSTP